MREGGSYIIDKDGKRKLVHRTQPAPEPEPSPPQPEGKKTAGSAAAPAKPPAKES